VDLGDVDVQASIRHAVGLTSASNSHTHRERMEKMNSDRKNWGEVLASGISVVVLLILLQNSNFLFWPWSNREAKDLIPESVPSATSDPPFKNTHLQK
jgi:hypothetical protein